MSEIASNTSANDAIAGLLDTLIPAEGGFPSASEKSIQAAFAVDVEVDGNQSLLHSVLDDLPPEFVTLSEQGREDALKTIETNRPADFAAIVRHVFNAYYTDQKVREVLEAVEGYPARPPHYAGYELEAFDENSLAAQNYVRHSGERRKATGYMAPNGETRGNK